MILTILAAAILYLAFPNYFFHYGFGLLAWFFAIPLFFALENQKTINRGLLGLFFGILFFSGLVSWVKAYNSSGYLAFVLVLSIQFMLFALLFAPRYKNKSLNLLFVPAAWVSAEYLHTHLLGGFSWNIGYSQSFNPYAIQIAGLLGSSAISFALIGFSYSLYKFIKDPPHRRFYAKAAAIIVIALFGYGVLVSHTIPSEGQSKHRLCLLQPNISSQRRTDPNEVDNILQTHLQLTRQILRDEKVIMVIWPETAITDDILINQSRKNQIINLVQNTGVHLLTGSALLRESKDFNSAVLFHPDGSVLGTYDKIHLVPFSEYTPFKKVFDGLTHRGYEFISGSTPGLFPLGNNLFGVSICSEDHYPKLFHSLKEKGAKFAVVLLNDGWFQQPEALITHAQASIIRAVETRTPIVRCSNTGWTISIDTFGRLKSLPSLPLNTQGYLLTTVEHAPDLIQNEHWHETFSILSLAFVLMNFIMSIKDQNTGKKL